MAKKKEEDKAVVAPKEKSVQALESTTPSAPEEAAKEIEVKAPEEVKEEPSYDLSVLKNADNVRVLIDYTNGRIGDDKVIAILDKVNRK